MNIPNPNGSTLVEVMPGCWVKPRMVLSVMVFSSWDKSALPYVDMRVGQQAITWPFDTVEQAHKVAREISRTVNDELHYSAVVRQREAENAHDR